ncbi:MAG: hypothetical protein AAFV53_01225, partial [Myxococcota bacterium]
MFNTLARIAQAHPEPMMKQLSNREAARASYHALLTLIRTGEAELSRRAVLQVLTESDQTRLAALL